MKKVFGRGAMLTASAAALAACAATPHAQIGAPPPALRLDPFYQRYLDAAGIPVTASSRVPDAAMRAARTIIVQMLEHRPDIRRALVAMGARVAIMAPEEGTTDLPEQRDWKKPARDDVVLTDCERKHYDEWIGGLSDRDYWNGRARGMGGLLTSGAAENLLAVPGTRYFGENIFVHEFSHEIMAGIRRADPALERRIEATYADAHARGIWKGEYIDNTVEEYWAEGTQFWFDSNMAIVIGGRRILSHQDLRAYDPALFALLGEVYGQRHHLSGDAFHRHPARIPPGSGASLVATAEIC